MQGRRSRFAAVVHKDEETGANGEAASDGEWPSWSSGPGGPFDDALHVTVTRLGRRDRIDLTLKEGPLIVGDRRLQRVAVVLRHVEEQPRTEARFLRVSRLRWTVIINLGLREQ